VKLVSASIFSLAAGLALAAPPAQIPDRAKAIVEMPIKNLLKPHGPAAPTLPSLPAPQPTQAPSPEPLDGAMQQESEKVAPGKVIWHRNVQAAHQAAQVSGKPVLVFQLLGDLDQRFA
jgi:hypothetical protein